MNKNVNNEKFSAFSKLLHWFIAILFLFQFLRFYNKQNLISEYLSSWHNSIGLLLFVIVSFRIIWIIFNWKTQIKSDKLVNFTHTFIYLLMFLSPLSAILLLINQGQEINFFGLALLPKTSAFTPIPWLGQMHGALSLSLIVLVIVHIALSISHKTISKKSYFS